MKKIEHQVVDGVEKKNCPRCKRWKSLECFGKSKNERDGLVDICKMCRYKTLRTSQINVSQRKWHIIGDGIEFKHCWRCRRWLPLTYFHNNSASWDKLNKTCKICMAETQRERNKRNPEKKKALTQKWRNENRKRSNELARKYYYEKPEVMRERSSKWAKNNREKISFHRNIRRYEDSKLRLNHSMSQGIYAAIKNHKNGRHWESLVGYTLIDLMKSLEKQFDSEMTWENYGQWTIDHKIPIAAFNFEKPEQIDFKRCWVLSNLQPMWKTENSSKNSKLSKPFQPALRIAA